MIIPELKAAIEVLQESLRATPDNDVFFDLVAKSLPTIGETRTAISTLRQRLVGAANPGAAAANPGGAVVVPGGNGGLVRVPSGNNAGRIQRREWLAAAQELANGLDNTVELYYQQGYGAPGHGGEVIDGIILEYTTREQQMERAVLDQRAFQTGTFSKENGKTSHRRLQTLRCEVCLTDRQSGRNL